jgi:Heparinase II/III-like protein/Heparinase II/III N-terminus
MQSFSWYLNRLGRMSAAEIVYRLQQATLATSERLADSRQCVAPAPTRPVRDPVFVHLVAGLDPAPYLARAERILAGRYDIFHLQDCDLGAVPQWNRDPLTKTLAPSVAAASLDYRDERLVGNIKYLWEPNRHLHLPVLAQAHVLSGDARYAQGVAAHIDSWIEQCPRGRGPNWASSLELAIRLINWSIAWQLLGGYDGALFADAQGAALRERWLRSVYEHARAITRKLSRFSSANNHLIGEAAGVWIASVTWSYWPQLRAWGLQCKQILGEEVFAQNAADGGNREQAFAYQQFVLDFLLLAGLAARAAGEDFPLAYWQRLERMIELIASMMDVAGHVPMIGDADDGYVVSLAPQPGFDNYRSLVASGAVLFERADFAGKAGQLDDKTRWLFGEKAVKRFAHPAGRFEPRRRFPNAGYYLLGDRLETREEIRLLVDAGALGYLSIAAHGHADALSVVLSVGGQEVLVDPGTYAYHTEPLWRRYFRSTRAHNTVLVDGQDQSCQSGNFMWSRHATARCLAFETGAARQRFVGEHDGYQSLSDPVTHRREIVYDVQARAFTITDALSCTASVHEAIRFWHFAETLEPVARGDEIHVVAGDYRVRLVPSEPPHGVEQHRGGSAEEGGWVSRGFGSKVPSVSFGWRSLVRGTTMLITHIYVEPLRAPAPSHDSSQPSLRPR